MILKSLGIEQVLTLELFKNKKWSHLLETSLGFFKFGFAIISRELAWESRPTVRFKQNLFYKFNLKWSHQGSNLDFVHVKDMS